MALQNSRFNYSRIGKYEVLSISTPNYEPDCEIVISKIPNSLLLSDAFYLFMTKGFVHELRMSVTGENFGRVVFVTLSSNDDAIKVMNALNEHDIEGMKMKVKFSKNRKSMYLRGFNCCQEQLKSTIQGIISAEVSINNFILKNNIGSCSVRCLDHYDAAFLKNKLKHDRESVFQTEVSCTWNYMDYDLPPEKRKKLWSSDEIRSCQHYVYKLVVNNLSFLNKDSTQENIILYASDLFDIKFDDCFPDVNNFPSDEMMEKEKAIFFEIQGRKQHNPLGPIGINIMKDIIKDMEKMSIKLKKFTE